MKKIMSRYHLVISSIDRNEWCNEKVLKEDNFVNGVCKYGEGKGEGLFTVVKSVLRKGVSGTYESA